VQVLNEEGGPLHYGEIARRALTTGLWTTDGRTPGRTINAVLTSDIKKRGDSSLFVRTGNGTYGLREHAGTIAPVDAEQPALPEQSVSAHSFSDAAEIVLKNTKNREPLHYRDIAATALSEGLITTAGKTPEMTMYAVILQEIKRHTARGAQPRFVKHGKGYVGLTEWMGKGLAFQIERHNRTIRKKLRETLLKLRPEQFEVVVGELLLALGFEEVQVTPSQSDGGIDVRGTLVIGDVIRTRMAVQAKRWKHNVQAPVVQQVRGSLGAHEQGLIITTSDFSSGAKQEAERSDAVPVALMGGEQMAALLVEHSIGVEKTGFDVLEISDLGMSEEE